MTVSTATMRVLEPAPGLIAFYDGRIEGARLHSDAPNWLDDGAYSLGVATYAVLSQGEALVYDTGISIAHATAIRAEIERRGVNSIRVVLSHHHCDHVAGTEVFADCEILAGRKTADALLECQENFAARSPAIDPLVMPTTVFDGEMSLRVGDIDVDMRPLDIHSFDGLVGWLPQTKTLLAGDTLEDPVTYVAEPERLNVHLAELDRMAAWGIATILPCHGDPDRVASGGYAPTLIEATRRYVSKLLRCRSEPELASTGLAEFISGDIANGALVYFDAYEAVHWKNVEAVLEL